MRELTTKDTKEHEEKPQNGKWREILDEIEFVPGPGENIFVWG